VAGGEKTVYAIPGASYTSTVAYDAPPVAPGGPFPLIVYSHGSGGQRFISTYLTEALAARGYVVVAVDHTGNTALDQFTQTTLPRSEIVRLRPIDVRAQIAALTAASADPASPFAGAVDPARVGLVGHSAGGTGVLKAAAGADGADVPAGLKAVVGLGTYVDPVTDAELERIDAPTMLISGTLDDVTPIKSQTERAWKRLGAEPTYRVDLKGGGHQSFSDVCYYSELVDARPSLPAPVVNAIKTRTADACTPEFLPIETAHALIDQYAIGFFDRYVKGADVPKAQLKSTDPKVVAVRVKR
jgi:predicted dienelactone hydrolase